MTFWGLRYSGALPQVEPMIIRPLGRALALLSLATSPLALAQSGTPAGNSAPQATALPAAIPVAQDVAYPGTIQLAIDATDTINAVTDLMLAGETQRILAEMPQGTRDEVRDYAKARLVALGWPGTKGRRRAA